MKINNLLLLFMPVLFLASCTASRTPAPALNPVSDILKSKAAQIKLTLNDMPDHFVALDSESNKMIGEENLLDIQSAFSFHSDAGNLEKIIGMTTVYPYSQRDPLDSADRISQQIELVMQATQRIDDFSAALAHQLASPNQQETPKISIDLLRRVKDAVRLTEASSYWANLRQATSRMGVLFWVSMFFLQSLIASRTTRRYNLHGSHP